jgi:hypothetical protein
MIAKLKEELRTVREAITHMEESDMALSREYVILRKKAKVLAKAIKKLEKLEVHSNG